MDAFEAILWILGYFVVGLNILGNIAAIDMRLGDYKNNEIRPSITFTLWPIIVVMIGFAMIFLLFSKKDKL